MDGAHSVTQTSGEGTTQTGPAYPASASLSAAHAADESTGLAETLTTLKRRIAALEFTLPAPGVDAARDAQRDMIDQIESYLLPRLRRGEKPLLVCVAGSTGAGKSTLVNSLVGAQVSNTGVRRPTTNSPVLACHPDDMVWFAEDRFLPNLPRVRQQGLAMPGRENMLVLAGLDLMPKGLALLDTPDIDSVVKQHHEFARQFLDAADVWLFVTTAARYADAAVWDWLRRGRARDAFLAVALSRVPPYGRDDLARHFGEMLDTNGLGEVERFFIPETQVEGGALPASVSEPIREWIDVLTNDEDRRTAVVARTLSGTLGSLRTRVPELAREVDAQIDIAADLRREAERAYDTAVGEISAAAANGSLVKGEVLARWQDFAGSGDLFRAISSRRGPGHRKERGRSPARLRTLSDSVQAGLESLIVVGARRAANDAVTRWNSGPAGERLLEGHAARLSVPSPELERRASRLVTAWQGHVRHLVGTRGVAKRSVARLVSFDDEALTVAFIVGLLGGADTPTGPLRLVRNLFGAAQMREVGQAARTDLTERVSRLYDEESLRFSQVIDAAGVPGSNVSVGLYEAAYNLEGAR
jgi:energy-coupling factor transporter ATP-binding protein EcfA2